MPLLRHESTENATLSSLKLRDMIRPKINLIYALDFDDSLINEAVVKELMVLAEPIVAIHGEENYAQSEDYFKARLQAILNNNVELLQEIYAPLRQDHYRKFVSIFSNRQSGQIDGFNAKSKTNKSLVIGSCFNIFKALFSKDAGMVRLIPILLADYTNHLTPGATFHALTEAGIGTQYITPLDRNKVILAYEQAHYAQLTYPLDKNIIKIYDDSCDLNGNPKNASILNRNSEGPPVLNQLADYYKAAPELLPRGVTLELYHYTGGKPILFTTIEGTGEVDIHYAKTIPAWIYMTKNRWVQGTSSPIYSNNVSAKKVLKIRATQGADLADSCTSDEPFDMPHIIAPTPNDDLTRLSCFKPPAERTSPRSSVTSGCNSTTTLEDYPVPSLASL